MTVPSGLWDIFKVEHLKHGMPRAVELPLTVLEQALGKVTYIFLRLSKIECPMKARDEDEGDIPSIGVFKLGVLLVSALGSSRGPDRICGEVRLIGAREHHHWMRLWSGHVTLALSIWRRRTTLSSGQFGITVFE